MSTPLISYNRKPSLDNAYARVSRAKYHLTRFKKEFTSFNRLRPSLAWYVDPHIGGNLTINLSLPLIMGILVGETIYNLRAALDYLVYELAILDSGKVQEGTQFPIEDSEQAWKLRMNGRKNRDITDYGCYLRGLSDTHKASIKRLQPQYGCNWTGTLKAISNPDKHKSLTITRATQTFSVVPNTTVPIILNPSLDGKTTLFHVRAYPRDNSVDVDTQVSLEVAFDDGTPVIKTLEILKLKVSEVIDMFNSDFK